jgi:O-antigen/teichoic acid export membrane protein
MSSPIAWARTIPRDYLQTYFTEAIVLLLSLWTYRLAALKLGEEGFSEYVLALRIVSFLLPVIILGLGVGIPRFTSLCSVGIPGRPSLNFLLGGIAVTTLLFSVLVVFAAVWPDTLAATILGKSDLRHLIWPILMVVYAQLLFSFAYGHLRGLLKMSFANSCQLLFSGLTPLLCMVLFATGAPRVLAARAIASYILCAGFLCLIARAGRLDPACFRKDLTSILRYGIGRVPGDVAFIAIFTLPITLTVHLSGISVGGGLAFGVSLLNMIGYLFAPVGLVLLPRASRWVAEGHFAEKKNKILMLILVSGSVCAIGIMIFEIFAAPVLRLFLGAANPDILAASRVCALAALPLCLYFLLRSVVDAKHFLPLNSKNLLVSFVPVVIWAAVAQKSVFLSTRGGAISLVVAIYVLGFLTVRQVFLVES